MIFKTHKAKKLSVTNLLNYLFIFLPLTLVTGPFLSDLSISILAVYFFFLKEKKYRYNYFIILFLLFCLLILTSTLTSNFTKLSLQSSLFYFRFGFYSVVVWYLIENNKNILKFFFLIIIIILLALYLDSLVQYATGFNIFNMKIIETGRISSFFGDELKMGSFVLRVFPIFIALCFFYYKDKNTKLINLILFYILFTFFIIYLSGERTSFFLYSLFIFLLIIFLNNFKKEKIKLCLFYFFITCLLVISDNPYKKRLIDLTINQVKNKSSDSFYIFSRQYNEHYISSYKIFKDNKITGIGPKNFRNVCKEEKYKISELSCSTHPHNTYLQLLSETGLPGFMFVFIIFLYILALLTKNLYLKIFKKKPFLNNFQISLFIALLISLWPLTPSGNFFNNWNSIIYYMPVGLLLWSFRNKKNFIISKNIHKLSIN